MRGQQLLLQEMRDLRSHHGGQLLHLLLYG
jgi:hypothetical protein